MADRFDEMALESAKSALRNFETVTESDLADYVAAVSAALRAEAERVRKACADHLRNTAGAKSCSCIEQMENGVWWQRCDCANGGDLAEAESWCSDMNAAAAIEALDLGVTP